MTTVLDGHITLDGQGVARIANTRMKVVHLVMDVTAHGTSPEGLRQQFPNLTLSQIHAALTYYYDHKAELDTQIQRRAAEAGFMQANAAPQPLREELSQRLREAGDSRA